ncbi:MAG: hypothetical protein HOQ28_20095 [Thermoleophilia bacterium]|nr:hypothetical protein [Thermoleophilia bacterium]
MSIELTAAQARAVAELAEREGSVTLHQIAETPTTHTADVYATPRGTAHGYRITVNGELTPIGETLPATG